MEHIAFYARDICFGRKQGQLFFRQGNIQKYLFFQNGNLVYARTNQPDELLGEILYRLGKISQDVYSRIEEYIEPKKSLGETLIANNLISRMDLVDGLTYQMREIILNMFPYFDAQFKFQEEVGFEEENFDVQIELPVLIEDGIRRMRYDQHIGDFFKGKVPVPTSSRYIYRLTDAEKEILEVIKGEKSTDEILQESIVQPELFWKSCFLFYCLQLIKLPGEAPSRVKDEPVKADPPVKTEEPEKKAGPEKREEEPAKKIETEKAKTVEKPVEKKEESADEAEKDISDKNINEVLEFNQNLRDMNYYQILDVARDASAVEIKKAYFVLARKFHPDLFARDLPDDVKTAIDDVFDYITKCYDTLSNEDKRHEYNKKIDTHKKGAKPDTDKLAEIKFRKGKTLYDQTRWPEALVFLEEAVRTKGDKGKYHLLLAMTQTKVPAYRRQAVKTFQKVIQLEPWNTDAYLGLGLLYKEEGMPTLAANQFKKVLSYDRDNKIARKELNLDKSGKKGLKDFFGKFKKK
jgi:tetratricopeptide (TPR) repeat protein